MDGKELKNFFLSGALDPVGILDDTKEERKVKGWGWKLVGAILSPLAIGFGIAKSVATQRSWNAMTKDMPQKPGFMKRMKFEFTGTI